MNPADRDTLQRYHRVLSSQLWPADLKLVSKRFRINHRLSNDAPIMPHLGAIFAAHTARCVGKSSPAEADATVRQLIEPAS